MTYSNVGRLLIVDDEVAQTAALARTLQIEGYSSTEAHSATQALSELRAHPFDVLITDLMMPDLDGVALLRAAQAIDENLVGIVMTGHGTIDTAVAAMKNGALDYILKPFNLTTILPVVSRCFAVRRLRLENAALLQRVAERTAELEALNRDLERTNEELRSVNFELDAFTATVAHDVRQPLYVMTGFAELLLEEKPGLLNSTQREYATDIHQGGQRLFRLIDDLLRFARLGRAPPVTQPVDVSALVQSTLAELRLMSAYQKATIRVGALPTAAADPALLKQVFTNILSNAVKFTRPDNPCIVEITGVSGVSHNSYSVRDNGIGFAMRSANKLFDIFHRLPGSEQFAGSGLGLSIARRIIERHGGKIFAESEAGNGACFTFTLPVVARSRSELPG
jgi:signal transduction histidine kinase